MSTQDGGPAFPTDSERQIGENAYHYQGMSLRDWFAWRALAGIMANPEYGLGFAATAKCAYDMADAMLRAREAAMLELEERS